MVKLMKVSLKMGNSMVVEKSIGIMVKPTVASFNKEKCMELERCYGKEVILIKGCFRMTTCMGRGY